MINKNKVLLAVLVAGFVGTGWYFLFHKNPNTENTNSVITATPSPSLSPTPSPTLSPAGSSLGKNFMSATCKIQGSIDFLSPTVATNNGSKISYTGIDSTARQIKWKVSPVDNLVVGPNIDVALQLPDGESVVGVTLPSSPVSKNYSLTASMTYGRYIGGEFRIYEAACLGQIKVTLSY
jgi:hypothetical protein